MTCKQISVLMENKPGRASAIASVLDKNDIDIRALSMADTADYGIMRLIVDNPDQACDALKAAGFTSSVTEVLAVEMPDTKGALSGILNVLTASGINVEYAYAFVTRNRDKAFLIIRTESLSEAQKALAKAGMKLLDQDEVYRM